MQTPQILMLNPRLKCILLFHFRASRAITTTIIVCRAYSRCQCQWKLYIFFHLNHKPMKKVLSVVWIFIMALYVLISTIFFIVIDALLQPTKRLKWLALDWLWNLFIYLHFKWIYFIHRNLFDASLAPNRLRCRENGRKILIHLHLRVCVEKSVLWLCVRVEFLKCCIPKWLCTRCTISVLRFNDL